LSKNIARIVVDNTDTTFDLQSTTVNVHVNAPITTTVYDARVTNLNGGNADKGSSPMSLQTTEVDKPIIPLTFLVIVAMLQIQVQ
jgi:hypothetical protein